jgi:hypothetical protein
MLIVRNIFVCRPGNASKLATQLKEAGLDRTNLRVLTDVTGDFNRVIMEYEVADLAGFEASMREYATDQAFREKMKGYTDLYVTGSREILKVV